MFYVSIAFIVIASISYHLAQKYTNTNANPVLVLLLTYAVAFVGTLALFVFFPLKAAWREELSRLTPANIVLGLAIIGIEIGWILAYRAGWQINIGSLVGNLLVALLLLPIGYVLFQERLTAVNLLGIVVCIAGLLMVNAR